MRLTLRRFGVAYDATTVHGELSCQLESGPVHLLYGASGSGKSTLLKALAGWHKRLPSMRVWGTAMLDERPLGQARVVLVQQALGFFVSTVGQTLCAALPNRGQLTLLEQRAAIRQALEAFGAAHILADWSTPSSLLDFGDRRVLSLCIALLGDPDVLLADEITAGLEPAPAQRLREILQSAARERIVLVTTHDQGDQVHYRNCSIYSLSIRPPDFHAAATEISDQGKHPLVAPLAIRRRYPTGFHWVLPQRLIAVARPGILADTAEDLGFLHQHGARHLLCLEESIPYDRALLPADLQLWHFPIVDMAAPDSVSETREFLQQLLARGAASRAALAVHCKAGLGRTGLICACLLAMLERHGAAEAVLQLRQLEPRFVQTEAQAQFVEDYVAALPDRATTS
ncbi:MAG: ATP-binding cassette domain-containing protein [Xanthomonadales bacterium]|jgi:energy-coupling factor transporter ATP-binding protein EcfA2|nr:ATP-binding cassette domain-containing protein [Xanthomonadales bacterium]